MRPTRVRLRVLVWLCLIAAIVYLQRSSISVTKEDMGLELELTEQQLGYVLGAFYLGYAAFQIPGGLLRDMWGTRATLAGVAALCAIVSGAMAFMDQFNSAAITWLTAGALQAAIFPCAVAAIRQWFPDTQRAMAAGWLAASMSIGGAVSMELAGKLVDQATWRGVFLLFAVPGLVWAVLFALLYRSRPELHSSVNAAELALVRAGQDSPAPKEDTVRGVTPWLLIWFTPSLVALYGQQFFRAAGQVFYSTWFPTYLQQTRQVSVADSGSLSSLPQIGIALGAILGGYVSDFLLRRTGNRAIAYQRVAILSLVGCALLIVVSFFIADATLAVLVIAAGSFLGSVGGPCAYAMSIDKGRRHVSSVFSTMNMAGNIGATLLPMALPFVVNRTSWNTVLFLFAGIFVAAAVCWIFVTPHGSIEDD